MGAAFAVPPEDLYALYPVRCDAPVSLDQRADVVMQDDTGHHGSVTIHIVRARVFRDDAIGGRCRRSQ
jgi:hypothetical protein